MDTATYISGPKPKYMDMMTLQMGAFGNWSGGDINITDSASLINTGSGSLSVSSNGRVVCTVGAQIVNQGLMTKVQSTTSSLLCEFLNYGTVDVNQGTLKVSNGSNYNTVNVLEGGTFTSAPDTGFQFTFEESSLMNVIGSLVVSGNTVFYGTFDATNGDIDVTAGRADFRAESDLISVGNPFRVSGGQAYFGCLDLPMTSLVLGSATTTTAVLYTDGNIITQTMTFISGTLKGIGTTHVTSSLELSTLSKTIDSSTLRANGLVYWYEGNVALTNNATFINGNNSVMTIGRSTLLSGFAMQALSGPSQFVNYGTVTKLNPNIVVVITPRVINYGTISSNQGELQISATGVQSQGKFVAVSPGTLTFIGSYVLLDPSTTIAGSGLVQLTNVVDLVPYNPCVCVVCV